MLGSPISSVMLAAALLSAAAELTAARSVVQTQPANLADFVPTVPGTRDPIRRFSAVFASADYAHRDLLPSALARLDSDIDAEIEHRRASGARLSKLDLRELTDARALLRSSVSALLSVDEDAWETSRRQARLTLEAVRLAYSALHPQQLATR